MEQVTAMQPVAEVATTPVPEVVVAPIAPPVPVPAPIQAPELALPSAPMPELSIPSITPEKIAAALPSMPEVSNVMPIAKAVAAPAADAINPLLIDAGIVVSLPLLAVAITAYVSLIDSAALCCLSLLPLSAASLCPSLVGGSPSPHLFAAPLLSAGTSASSPAEQTRTSSLPSPTPDPPRSVAACGPRP